MESQDTCQDLCDYQLYQHEYDDYCREEFMSSNKVLYCERCTDRNNSSTYYIHQLEFVCSSCLTSANDPSSTIVDVPTLRIKNSGKCILSQSCKNDARWKCSKGLRFCDSCHMRNCLDDEQDHFQCKPEPLFISSSMMCSICKNLPVEYFFPLISACNRCAPNVPNAIDECFGTTIYFDINDTKDKVKRISKQISSMADKSATLIEKSESVMEELQLLDCLKHVKYTIANPSIIDEALKNTRREHTANKEIHQLQKRIRNFFQNELLLCTLVEKSAVDLSHFNEFLDKVTMKMKNLEIAYHVPCFRLASE